MARTKQTARKEEVIPKEIIPVPRDFDKSFLDFESPTAAEFVNVCLAITSLNPLVQKNSSKRRTLLYQSVLMSQMAFDISKQM